MDSEHTVTYAGVGTAELAEPASSDEQLSDLEGRSDGYTIHGIAIGDNDVTLGGSGKVKVWPGEELRRAADTLQGQPLVRDHENNTTGKVGEVLKSHYIQDVGVVYEAEIAPHYEQLAKDIQAGLMDVSVRALHAPEEELEENDRGALVVQDTYFDNLSIVNDGAAPSNTAEAGPLEAKSDFGDSESIVASASSQRTGTVATLSRSSKAKSADIDDLSMTSSETPSANHPHKGNAENIPGDDGEEDDDEDEDNPYQVDVENLADIPGTYTANGTTFAVAPDEHNDEYTEHADDAKYPMTSCTGDNSVESAWRLRNHGDYTVDSDTVAKRIRAAAEAMDCDMEIVGAEEASSDDVRAGPPNWSEGDWVEWQVNPDAMFGKVVHNPDDKEYVMVEVWHETDSGYSTTTHTNTVGPGDIRELNEERAEEITSQMEMEEELEASYTQGDWVNWDTRNSTEIGTVVGSYQEGDDIPDFRGDRGLSPEGDEYLYALRMYKKRDGTYHPIEGKPIGHYEDSLRSADEPSDVSESTVELSANEHSELVPRELSPSARGQYDLMVGQWVQWYPDDTEMSGKHGKVDDSRDADEDEDGEKILTIREYDQEEDGTWVPQDNMVELPEEEVAPWGNYPDQDDIEQASASLADDDARQEEAPESDQKEGSDRNDEGSADSTPEDIDFSDQVETALQNKVDEHNEEYGDDESKRVTLRKLKAVFRRGAGAYSDSHREGMTRNQWSFARVNAFLYLLRNGNPENDAYTQDNDLLPDGHPRATENAEPSQTRSGSQNTDSDTLSVWFSPTEQLASPDASMDELDEVYSDWDDAVNMTASELEEWSENPCAQEASLKPDTVIERNMELLETNKSDWTTDHISDAKRTISFIARMSDETNEPSEPREGPHGCPSEWAISLLNWAHNPFDNIPDVPDEMEDNMSTENTEDEVGESELMDYGPDHDDVFDTESDAQERSQELGLNGATHEHEMDGDTYYMPGPSMDAYESAVDENAEHGDMEDEDEDEEDDEGDMEDDEDEMSARVLPVATLPEAELSETRSASVSDTSATDTTMIEYEPTKAEGIDTEGVDEPVVVEQSDLEELSNKAEKAEDVEAELSSLSERLDQNQEAAEIVEELSDDEIELIESETDARVVEASAADMFDEAKQVYAEQLAEFAPFTAEELADKFTPAELKERVEDHSEAELSSSIDETDIEPDSGSASEEELADVDEDEAELRSEMAARLEKKGWDNQAEKVRSGELEVVRQE